MDYNVIVSEAPRNHQGWGSTLLPQLPPLSDRGEPVFCLHVFSFQLATRWTRCFIVGCYVPPGSVVNTKHIAKALCHCPDCPKTILIGDINVNISHPEVRKSNKDIEVMLVVEEME